MVACTGSSGEIEGLAWCCAILGEGQNMSGKTRGLRCKLSRQNSAPRCKSLVLLPLVWQSKDFQSAENRLRSVPILMRKGALCWPKGPRTILAYTGAWNGALYPYCGSRVCTIYPSQNASANVPTQTSRLFMN